MKNCDKYDNWTECEKRGCNGCNYNRLEKYKTTITKEQLIMSFKEEKKNEKI